MIGHPYEGFTVVMALVNPHPALKVAAPESPMVDGWMGDDWFHYGAFRQINLDYFAEQTTEKGDGEHCPARRLRRLRGLPARRLGRRLRARPRARAVAVRAEDDGAPRLRRVLAGTGARQAGGRSSRSTVPTMWMQGLWDQEDMWGAIHCYLALKAQGQATITTTW